jgi:hypothetical protein
MPCAAAASCNSDFTIPCNTRFETLRGSARGHGHRDLKPHNCLGVQSANLDLNPSQVKPITAMPLAAAAYCISDFTIPCNTRVETLRVSARGPGHRDLKDLN